MMIVGQVIDRHLAKLRTRLPYVPARIVTLRSGLMAAVHDLLDDASMECAQTEEALTALVVEIADYREEGRPLFPRVLICDDVEAVLRNLQGASAIQIAGGDRGPATLLRALKKCAPLAENGWSIWVDRRPGRFEFGVFREPSPTGLDIRQTLLDTQPNGPLRAVLLSQRAPGVIELVAAGQEGTRIHLSGMRDDRVPPGDRDIVLIDWLTEDLTDAALREPVGSFVGRALQDIFRKGHGTLVAVVPSGGNSWLSDDAEDAVVLTAPVDIAQLVANHTESASSSALHELSASVGLLGGMLNSDGVTVLDTRGRIVAFSWFVKTDTSSLTARATFGGARHRAFAALSSLVDDKKLRGAFIRSSDGAEQSYGEEL